MENIARGPLQCTSVNDALTGLVSFTERFKSDDSIAD